MSDSLQLHGLQHTRPPCPSPTSRACSNSCPSSQWCHPTISSSVVPFSSSLQSFPASGSFQRSQFLSSGGQGIGASASASFFARWHVHSFLLKWTPRDFPGGPVVKNLPCNAEDVSSTPGQGTKISHAEEQLSLCEATRESVCCNERSWRMQRRSLHYT